MPTRHTRTISTYLSEPDNIPAGESLIWALARESGKFNEVLRYPVEDSKDEKPLIEAIDRMKERFGERPPSALFFASGPSRTGDIERTLVLGVHGPGEVYVFLMNDKRS